MDYNKLKITPHDNQENWKIEGQEKCTFLPKRADANKEPYLVNIWKTMPYIARELPRDHIVVVLDKSCFCNDTDCKPAVAPMIYEQNYRSLYKEDNRFFNHRWLNHGAELLLAPWNGDYDDMRVTTKQDPSYCINCASEHPVFRVQIDYEPHVIQNDIYGGGVY